MLSRPPRFLVLSILCLGLVCLPVVLAQAAGAGTIKGMVTYDDKVPNLRPLDMGADPDCAKLNAGKEVMPQVLELGDGNAMAWVFVQVTGIEGDFDAPSDTVVIDQNGCRYDPHVVGLMTGQTLMFRNSDGIMHNVHLLPKANREKNFGMPPTVKETETTFSQPEPAFQVKCDVHPWMNAYVAVMSHPYFDTSGLDGKFEISGVPAGTYEVVAWHEKLGKQTATVTVPADGEVSADFSFKVPGR